MLSMDTDDLLFDLIPVRPEHTSAMEGRTHTCRHIPAILDEGRRVTTFPVRFRHPRTPEAVSAVLCRECFVRLPRENQICKN
jgi:hypothetical protein